MYIVRAEWYCEDDRKVIKDVRLFSAVNNQELGRMLDEQYDDTLIRFDAHWVGEDSDCIELTEDIAAAIEKIYD